MSTWNQVRSTIATVEQQGTVGVALIGPDGTRLSHNGTRGFRAASVVKIPLMIAVYQAVERGELALSDRITLAADDKTHGSGVLLHLHDGIELTLNDLIYLMISISDNTATNQLIDLVGMERVNDTIGALGMTGSNLGRKMRGRPAIEGEAENIATPDDYATVVRTMLDERAATPESCAAMLGMLRRQQNDRRIARYVPEDEHISWGSKTGSIAGVTNDVGYVTTPAGELVIAVFCEGFPDQHTGEAAIGEIARAALVDTRLLDDNGR